MWQACRRLFLRDIERTVSIGIHDFELATPQRILIDVDLFVPLAASSPQHDAIAEVVDYDFVRECIDQVLARGHINLQETLCDEIVRLLLAHPQVVTVRVATRKPDVYPDTQAVGVERIAFKADGSATPAAVSAAIRSIAPEIP